MIDSQSALSDTSDRRSLLILPAMLVRRGKYSVADPLFVEERRPVLVARKLRRGAEAGANREIGERRDLRHLPTVTIDGADAKDFDDAISVQRTADGFKVWVHIADVTHYVEL